MLQFKLCYKAIHIKHTIFKSIPGNSKKNTLKNLSKKIYLSNDLKSGNLNTCNKLPCMARTKELNKRLCEVVQENIVCRRNLCVQQPGRQVCYTVTHNIMSLINTLFKQKYTWYMLLQYMYIICGLFSQDKIYNIKISKLKIL